MAAWGWLGAYLTVFLRVPFAGGQAGAEATPRFYVFAWLLRPDDLVRDWIGGVTWSTVAQRVTILGLAAAILLVALAAGWSFLRLLRVDRFVSRVEMSIFSVGVGLNLVSLVTLALGLAGWLRWEPFAAVAVLVCLVSAVTYRRAGCASGTQAVASTPADELRLNVRSLWLAAPFAAAILLSATLPPGDFDVREYHLQAPKEFYQGGRITFLPHNVYGNMPLGAEMLSLPAMVILGDWWMGALVGKTLIATFAPLAALALFAAGCRFASRSAGIVAAIVYLSVPWIAAVSSQGLIEGAFAFYLFAAFFAAMIWSSAAAAAQQSSHATQGTAGLLLLAGFLSGAAVSTKYPAVLYSVLPLATYLAIRSYASRSADKSRALRGAGTVICLFVLSAALGCGLWLAKNAVLTGNPVYPLLYGFFDGATRTPQNDVQWRQAHLPPNDDPRDLMLRIRTASVTSDWLSPLLVPLAVLAFVGRKSRPLALLLGGYVAFVFIAWWLGTHRIDRFLLPALPLAALLAGLGAAWSGAESWRRTLAAFLAFGLVYNFLVIAGGMCTDNRYLADLETLRVDARRVNPWHLYFNSHANEVTGLLLVGDAQPFDLEVPVLYNTVFDDSALEQLVRDKTPVEVRQTLARRGISHVYVAWDEIARYRQPGNYGISDYLRPQVFADLVAEGVLAPLPLVPGNAGQAFRVLPAPPHDGTR
jgi:hypothetical protein